MPLEICWAYVVPVRLCGRRHYVVGLRGNPNATLAAGLGRCIEQADRLNAAVAWSHRGTA
ncbi:MAG: hypothetical protein HYT80_00535 [Euryarchaeota archaeon]|nr:hypothetical protein [Euryarchaeota archaeon]